LQENKELDTLKCYFEVEILNGGFSDEIVIGVSSKANKSKSVG